MKLRIVRPVSGSIDGIDLNRFDVGSVYEIGTSLGCYLLAMGAAEPVAPPHAAPSAPDAVLDTSDHSEPSRQRSEAMDRPRKRRKS